MMEPSACTDQWMVWW